MIAEFDPVLSFTGGLLIGLASVALMLLLGRIAGISGIAIGILSSNSANDRIWRFAFLGGLILAPLLYQGISGAPVPLEISDNLPALIIGGGLVGFGAILGGGCTSGHGICGIGRFSKRSIVSVIVFMATSIIVYTLSRHVFGWLS